MPFTSFGLHPDLLKGIRELGFIRPTPIQEQAIFAVDASSTRSWLYLSIVAFVPPVVLFGVWRDDHSQTIREVMRGTGS
jgi:hypothetical protein